MNTKHPQTRVTLQTVRERWAWRDAVFTLLCKHGAKLIYVHKIWDVSPPFTLGR